MFKHKILYNSIQEKIISGAWYEGMLIPSESQLCDIYQVSRITVRRALKELEDKKLVYKIQGKGTFVRASINDVIDPSGIGYNEDTLVYDVLEAQIIPVSRTISLAMKLPKEETEVFYIKRLRFRNNKPETIVKSWYRVKIGEELIKKDLHLHNTLTLISEISEQPIVNVQTILIPVNPTIEEARMLDLSITSAHAKLKRTAKFTNSVVAEYAEAFVDSEDIDYSVVSWGRRDSEV